MGKFFELAEPPSQDLARAQALYCRAAADAHPEALSRLGWIYAKGAGVARDDQIASTMFRWAAELGDEAAISFARGLKGGGPAVTALPPCLLQVGEQALLAARVKRKAGLLPTPTVEKPASFRSTPPADDHRKLVQLVVQEARQFRLDPRLVLAVMRTESNFDPQARSPKDAQGLMQLIPETAQRFNVRDILDPLDNLRGGMAYLRWLLAYYRGDVTLTLAAYNSGERAVDRHRGVPPFAETISYVQRIRSLYPFDRHPFDSKALAAGEKSWIAQGLAATGGEPTTARQVGR